MRWLARVIQADHEVEQRDDSVIDIEVNLGSSIGPQHVYPVLRWSRKWHEAGYYHAEDHEEDS